ncbi:hypothetical protein ACJRO7_018053 [Eucalyptus globulus]|uniref:PGG domain-containing protein n=1 Tax=Eucalyptus globulus TaxID=34317 RepID=A0ABD3KYL9_EUCGL
MDPRLFEASYVENVDQRYSLIRENVLILNIAFLVVGDNPLHVASMAGHMNLVREVLKLRTEFASELNQDGFSPLHIAAARGEGGYCSVAFESEQSPGGAKVLKELVSTCPDSVEEVTGRRESVLHLTMKNGQFEAFKLLVLLPKRFNKQRVGNCRDGQGNQILHLAVYRKQYETSVVKFLLSGDAIDKDLIDVNARNEVGLTPLDILLLVNNEAGDAEMVEILMRSRATRIPTVRVLQVQEERDSPSDVRNALLVVAALITIATYQAMLQPPGGLWQDNSGSSSSSTAGFGYKSLPSYILFIISNSAGFFASARMITVLTLGFPMQMELQVALFALIGTYATVMSTHPHAQHFLQLLRRSRDISTGHHRARKSLGERR